MKVEMKLLTSAAATKKNASKTSVGGNRITGIWFVKQTRRLLLCFPINLFAHASICSGQIFHSFNPFQFGRRFFRPFLFFALFNFWAFRLFKSDKNEYIKSFQSGSHKRFHLFHCMFRYKVIRREIRGKSEQNWKWIG